MYAFGFDSPILNLFSYPQRGCKKNLRFFTAPCFYKTNFNLPTYQTELPQPYWSSIRKLRSWDFFVPAVLSYKAPVLSVPQSFSIICFFTSNLRLTNIARAQTRANIVFFFSIKVNTGKQSFGIISMINFNNPHSNYSIFSIEAGCFILIRIYLT